MKTFEALALITFVQIAHSFVYMSETGETYITYIITFTNKCRKEGKIAAKSEVTLPQCVEECSLRQNCSGVNYKKRFRLCELLSLATEDYFSERGCIFIPASDISVSQNPCEGSECSNGKACDSYSATCISKECPNIIVLANGEIEGNMLDVGSKVKHSCNDGYKERSGITYGVCLESGQWYPTAECVPDCGDPPAIINGVASRDVSDEDIYSVTCDIGFQGSKGTFQCLQPGTWGAVTCDRIACGMPPAISNGDVWLDTPGEFLYLDTATVACHAGYQSSAVTITCTSNGSWESVTCEPISCGELPPIPDGTSVLDIADGNKYLDTATVTCDSWYKTRNNVIQCTATGDWETAICADCYLTTSQDYKGKTNQTSTGKPCLNWAEMSDHWYHDSQLFPDSSVLEANNFCRNPNTNDWKPWCYINYVHVWENCGIDICV